MLTADGRPENRISGRAADRAGVRPTFVNVGPGRSGTSWLLKMLDSHPDISMSSVKETEFFNTNYSLGVGWYLSHFKTPAAAVGEISNMYYLDPAVPDRLHEFDPSIKVIFNIRDPESLLRSMISYAARRGLDGSDPAILDEPMGRIMGSGFEHRRSRGTTTPGDVVPLREAVLLTRFVEPYLERFGREQVYFLIYDRIAREPASLLSEIYAFLGVDPEHKVSRSGQVVNDAIQPRMRWIGAFASRVAFALRRVGAYGVLGRLHRSRMIKKVFYRATEPAGAASIPPSLKRALVEERRRLIELVPELRRFWTAG